MDQSRQYTLVVGRYIDTGDEHRCGACGAVFAAGEMVVTLVDGGWDEVASGVDASTLHGRCAAPLVAQLAQGQQVWP